MTKEISYLKEKMQELSSELINISQAELKTIKTNLTQMKKIHSYIPEREAESWGFFSLFRRNTDELTYSYILAYLLDPNRPHGLGDLFLREFYGLLQKREPTIKTEYNIAAIEVITEVPIGRRRIDLIVDMESSMIVVENKIYSSEGDNQTIDIQIEIETVVDYKNKEIIYVFLTPKGLDAQNDNFIALSYIEIAEIIRNLPFSTTNNISPKTTFLLSELSNQIKEEFEVSGKGWEIDDKSRLYLDYQKEISDITKSFEGYLEKVKIMAKDIAIAALQVDEGDWLYLISRTHYQQLYKKSWTIDNQNFVFFETWIEMNRIADAKKFILMMGTHDQKIRQSFFEHDPSIENALKAIGSKYKPREASFAIAYKEYDLEEDLANMKSVVEQAYQEHAFLVEKTDTFFDNFNANNNN